MEEEYKMGIILDIILIAIIALSTFLAYKKGLVKVAVKLCAFLIAVIITLLLYKPVSNIIIDNTQLDEKIENLIIENGTKEIKENDENSNNKNFISYMQKYIDDTVTNTQNDVIENIAEIVSIKVINILVIIGLFLVTRIALILLTLISDIITNLPIIKQFNKLGGIIYGLIRGLILVYVILAIVFFIVSMTANNSVVELINSSILTRFMYANNILLNIIF